MKPCWLFFCVPLCLFSLSSSNAQSLSQSQLTQIDNLFSAFDQGPPIAYGIICGDTAIGKEFGAEAYTCKVPGPTPYRLGNMALHFTAYAILTLEAEGRIRLSDEISAYLGPGEGVDLRGITIRQLLNHSHGLPEYWALKSLMGFTNEERFTTADADQLFTRKLNNLHPPGQRVFFSGTGAYLMARIIEKLTGDNLHAFTQRHIFKPLEMEHTYFTNSDRVSNIVSYSQSGEIYEPQMIGHYDNGPVGVITTLEDLLTWFTFMADQNSAIKQKMDEPILLSEEKIAEIPDGMITYGQQFMHEERGVNKIWDYGQIGGFASSVYRFPKYDLSIVILSKNGIYFNGFLGMQISDILLEDEYTEIAPENRSPIALTEEFKEKIIGSYFDPIYYNYRQIRLQNDTLRYFRPDYGTEQALYPMSKEELWMPTPRGDYYFTLIGNSLQLMVENVPYTYDKVAAYRQKSQDLSSLCGTYLCESHALVLSIKQGKNGNWVLEAGNEERELHSVDGQQFVSAHSLYKSLTLKINAQDEIIGILISNPGIRDLVFKKFTL
ncbi:MAG: serine hydrolase domain-containing protein [Bacteroidota bacterium]